MTGSPMATAAAAPPHRAARLDREGGVRLATFSKKQSVPHRRGLGIVRVVAGRIVARDPVSDGGAASPWSPRMSPGLPASSCWTGTSRHQRRTSSCSAAPGRVCGI